VRPIVGNRTRPVIFLSLGELTGVELTLHSGDELRVRSEGQAIVHAGEQSSPAGGRVWS
jgi:hypothetical protein